MKDIVLFESSDPNLFNFFYLKKKRVIIEIKNIKDVIKNKNREALFYSPTYMLEEKPLSLINRGVMLICYNDFIHLPKEKKSKKIAKIRAFIGLCKRNLIPIALSTCAKSKEFLRTEWERGLIGITLGLTYEQAINASRRTTKILENLERSE